MGISIVTIYLICKIWRFWVKVILVLGSVNDGSYEILHITLKKPSFLVSSKKRRKQLQMILISICLLYANAVFCFNRNSLAVHRGNPLKGWVTMAGSRQGWFTNPSGCKISTKAIFLPVDLAKLYLAEIFGDIIARIIRPFDSQHSDWSWFRRMEIAMRLQEPRNFARRRVTQPMRTCATKFAKWNIVSQRSRNWTSNCGLNLHYSQFVATEARP